ncbi:hypothetical protein D918_00201 [Trichuris suis]|nr:hypothetical protein D918_00201 [Trichuris suis]
MQVLLCSLPLAQIWSFFDAAKPKCCLQFCILRT